MAKRIANPSELNALRARAAADIDLRTGGKDLRITVHMGTCGIAAGARDVLTALMAELSQAGVATVTLQQAGCAGLCDQEPMISLADKAGGLFRYGKLDKGKVRRIVQEHVVHGRPVQDCLLKE